MPNALQIWVSLFEKRHVASFGDSEKLVNLLFETCFDVLRRGADEYVTAAALGDAKNCVSELNMAVLKLLGAMMRFDRHLLVALVMNKMGAFVAELFL